MDDDGEQSLGYEDDEIEELEVQEEVAAITQPSIESTQHLCETPDVESGYLEVLQGRVASFKNTRKSSFHGEELTREKAIKLATEARIRRNAALKAGHGTILDLVTGFFGMEYKDVVDCVIDYDEHVALLTAILKPGGITTVVFNQQLLPPPPLESGRVFSETHPPFKRLVVTDGTTMPLRGKALVIYKMKKEAAIEYNNIYETLHFVPFDAEEGGTLLTTLEMLLDQMCCDHLRITGRWGELMKVETGPHYKKMFLGQLEAYERFLQSTQEDILKKPEFFIPEDIMAKVAKCDQSIIYTHKTNPELFTELENMIQYQYTKIDRILLEGDKIQQSLDDAGPRAELEYWRSRLTQLSSLLDFVQCQHLKVCLTIVQKSLTFYVKDWSNLADKVRTAVNEAVDNVKYLYDFDRISQTLYSNHLKTLGNPLRDLLYNVRMVFTTSRYYNTTERVTAVFVKITNQLVTRCKAYLTDDGERSIWSLTHLELIQRIQDCIDLHVSYKKSFAENQEAMINNPKEKPFGCSQANVFVKLTTFIQRLTSIRKAVQLNLDHSILHSSCLEGVVKITTKFDSCMRELATKTYDPLDEQKLDFEKDYEVYLQKFNEAEEDLRSFCSNIIADCPTVLSALHMIKRFEELNLPSLCLELEYLKQFEKFYDEMENIMDRFNDERTNMTITRGMPPVAGRIAWARMLVAKLKAPMDLFQTQERVINLPQPQLAIRRYNRLCKVLVNYEMLHHEEWMGVMARIDDLLHIPILSLAADSSLSVNWHDYIKEQLLEVKFMRSLDLEVPDSGFVLYSIRQTLLRQRLRLCGIVQQYNKLRRSIPDIYLALVKPQLYKLDVIVDTGIIEMTWMSVGIDQFCDSLLARLGYLEVFFQNIRDIKKTRIEEQVEAIAKTVFIKVDYGEPLMLSDYQERQGGYRTNSIRELNTRIMCVERAAIDIVNSFVDKFDVPSCLESKFKWLDSNLIVVDEEKRTSILPVHEEEAFQRWERPREAELPAYYRECMKVYNRFFKFLINSLLSAVHQSITMFLDKLTGDEEPIIIVHLLLDIPQVRLRPTLQEIQAAAMELSRNVIKQMGELFEWGKTDGKDDDQRGGIKAHSYSKIVAEDREVLRLMRTLQGVVIGYTPSVEHLSQMFLNFSFLWEQDRQQHFTDFLENDPSVFKIEDEMGRVTSILKQIQNLPDTRDISGIRMYTEQAKQALMNEANGWKQIFCQKLISLYSKKMKVVFDFVKERQKILQRAIADLDDVRAAFGCLDKIRGAWFEMDNEITKIEDTFALLIANDAQIPPDVLLLNESMRTMYTNMVADGRKCQDNLIMLQEPFKQKLVAQIAQFSADEQKFHAAFMASGPGIPGISAKEASDRLTVAMLNMDSLYERWERNADGEKLFGLPVTQFPELDARKKQIILLNRLYSLYETVMKASNKFMSVPWAQVDVESMATDLTEFQNRYKKLPRNMAEYPAYSEVARTIDSLKDACPLLELLAHPAMRDRHWDKLAQLTGYSFPFENETFCLRDVMSAPLLRYKDEVEDICIGAQKEREVEAKLKGVIADWSGVMLSFGPFKKRGDILLKGQETGEIIALLEDSSMVLSSLFTNRYNGPFKKDIQLWMKRLARTSESLETWMQVQNLWLYLEAVFGGGDIARQLPKEAKRFSNVDKTWMRLMSRAKDVGIAVDVASDDATYQLLPHLLEQLEACQKSLTGYLENLRRIFPRFYFVSDPALLEILGQASDCHTIQNHLLNVFENVYLVEFDEKQYEKIIGFYSREMEHIRLEDPVLAVGAVEVWLSKIMKSAQLALNAVIGAASAIIAEPTYDIVDLLNRFPAQVGLLTVQFLWTTKSEAALRKSRKSPSEMKVTNIEFLKLLNLLIEQTTRNLTKVERTKYETLVTIHVHQRDMFDELTRRRIRNVLDFEWLKNMRFYWDVSIEETWVRVTDVNFLYQNEFMGCTERLVITPLTDRCYITLAQAIGMSMGGAPAGPAGTGKTETTKDMAKALGKYCVVFNCSDQMDFRGLGRIFKGLAQSGSWGCFDEFNRIDLPVLSVAAQQVSIVLTARREHKTSFIFSDGDTVSLNQEFGLFITMNPGYAGRQELPENLKIMFRPIAMMVPDRQIIMRVKLASCGFKENIDLARKFFVLYRLCEEQLSKQVHYDFGLRNILSVLRTLGANKRSNPNDSEETTVKSVLENMNISKLVDEDEPLFKALIRDLFPGSEVKGSSYKDLQKAISAACRELGLINHPPWNLKLIQLYETSLVRHGLMLLGPTGSGKTTCERGLMKALTLTGLPHKEMRMNPKAITAPQMFGRLDVSTNDWTDGIFSTLWRRSLKVPKTDTTWLILDGPVDAVWIENLNSVLDDNKTLTLANGDRITMAPNCRLVFEPDNVTNASPATVSRMGMTFLSASIMPWKSILEGWFLTRPSNEVPYLRPLFDKVYGDLQEFLSAQLKPAMYIQDAIYIRQCTQLLEGLLHEIGDTNLLSETHWERIFLFALMWSLGSVLELADRAKMASFLLAHPSRMCWPAVEEGYTIFDYVVDGSGAWQSWTERVEEYNYPDDYVPDYLSILVPNIDNVRTAYLIRIVAARGKSVLLIGEQGTAKTVMMKSYLSELDPEYHLSRTFNFSSATTPNMVQRIIESYVEKRVGPMYGPPGSRKMTVFIDDLSMPVVNAWGDQITNELVRQQMEQGGFYSLERPGEFSTILDVNICAAMIHPGGGRNDIPHRLKRQFCVFNCTLPSQRAMDKIFSVIAEGYFCETRFCDEVVEMAPRLVNLTRIVWAKAKATMLPTPAKFHYVFNLRDLSRIWQGILMVTAEGCNNRKTLIELWRHECQRVLTDRFVTLEEQTGFGKYLRDAAVHELGELGELLDKDNRYFVNFLRDAPEPTGDEPDDFSLDPPKIYELADGWDRLKFKLREYAQLYNETARGGKLDLVYFTDAMRHVAIISRVINSPRGSMVCVGVGGSGKQSLAKLASYVANFRTFQIAMTRIYNVTNFLEDLKDIYRTAGEKGQGVTFIFTENEIKDETFLEYLNNILSAGEVANLFAKDESEEIANGLVLTMKKEFPRRNPTIDALYEYFLLRSQRNIHIVLCFSPVGPKFRTRAMKFPGLISGCTVNWFQKWPFDALMAVSNNYLQEFPIICTPAVKNEVITVLSECHEKTRDICAEYYERFRRLNHVTPKSFLSFLKGYKDMYNVRLANIKMLDERMSVGVLKLVEAAAGVDILKKELELKEKDIAIASAAAEKVMVEVTKTTRATEQVKEELQVVKERAEAMVTDIAQQTMVAESKLTAAKPALMAAELALQTIKAADIATVRKLAKPPYLITVIMDVVCLLFQKKLSPIAFDEERNFFVMSWSESLKLMADTRFLLKLQTFPKDKINAETLDLMMPYLKYPDYTYQKAVASSGNVAGLIQWTRAMADFYQVNKDVLPLKANLAIQQAKLSIAQRQLSDAKAFLDEKQKELDAVQLIFNEAYGKQQVVLKDAMACKSKMDTASALIKGLTGERQRWTEMLTQFSVETERLVGDAVLLTAFLCYCGPFNQEFRSLLWRRWSDDIERRKIPFTSNMNITKILTDAATIGEWNVCGLPLDELSVQNGILVTKAPRYPLLVDPQTQGKNWIKNMERENELQVTTLNHKYFRNHLEDCVNLGRPLLVEDIAEELDPVMDNVLEKNYMKMGFSLKVKVGDKEVDIHPDFRCYITTKLPNPAFPPEVAARTALIDFTVTMKGLEEQLLGRVIISEQKELEVERLNLIKGVTSNRREMEELEAGLLQKLSTCEGSLLEDVELVKMLNVSKDTAADLRMKLEVAEKTEAKLNIAREEFRPVATRGSVSYFLIKDMAMVNCMYQTSLAQFLERFDVSLELSEKHLVPAKRIALINDYLTFEVCRYKARGLYVVNKFMFTLLLTLKIDMQRDAISMNEFNCFVKGGAALDLLAVAPKPAPWISDTAWLNLVQLSIVRPFQNLVEHVTQKERIWRAWFNKECPEEEVLPDPYNNLEIFKKLLLVRAWCPDRTYAASRKYIAAALGNRFANPVVLNMEAMIAESRPNTPLLCLLSAGSDPTPQIERLAKVNMVICKAVSMGQGQEIHARALVGKAMNEGGWVLLQNCHLGLEYMTELYLCLIDAGGNVHPDFRIFITTEPHESFPISLLQISIKFTNEAPQGVRAGLMRTYGDMSQDILEVCDAPEYLPLLFVTSFFHTQVQERRKFGPLGWNIPYEFNSADFFSSATFIRQHLDGLEKNASISWSTMRYMIGEIQYGGRVTDDYDKRLLNTITKLLYGVEVLAENSVVFPGYPIHRFKTLTEYMEALDTLPGTDSPSVVGLHPNANIVFQTDSMNAMMSTILSIQPKAVGSVGGMSREQRVSLQVSEMLSKIPANYDPFETKKRLKALGELNPLEIFLRQEIDRMRFVLSLVKKTLQELLLAIDGAIIMNESLSEAMDKIDDARIPAEWLRWSWASSSLGFWYSELIERNIQFSTWLAKGRPIHYWMTGFFNAQGFLTAMRQEVARAHRGWALDAVVLTNTVLRRHKEEVLQAPPEGVYVYKLFLEGAGWDKNGAKLMESAPKVLTVLMPVIHISAINSNIVKKDPTIGLYQCPVYKKPVRTDLTFVTALYLSPSDKSPEHWTERSVALLCDTK